MAVTITQQPTSPNAAYTRLPYVVSGSFTTSNPQYQYVMDIYESGSSDMITRVTQTPNPAGVATFDPSRIFQGELEEDQVWKSTNMVAAVNSSKTFVVKFGEQYGTSVSSSVTVYPDLTSRDIKIIPAVVDPNNGISYNWQSGSFLPEGPYVDIELTNDPLLVDNSNRGFGHQHVWKPVGNGDWETISYLDEGTSYIDYDVMIYKGEENIYTQSDIPLSYNTSTNMVYLGVGPKNLIQSVPALSTPFDDNWTHYEVRLYGPGGFVSTYYVNEVVDPTSIYNTQFFDERIKTYLQPTCNRDKTRFAFINRYGVWDYYNNYNPVRRSSNIIRENVTLPQLDYSSISSPYNANNRGEKNYYTEVKDRFEVDTPLLDKDMANWLEELLDSPSVYVQKGDCFVPVIVTNSQYEHNNETSRNKLFQYTITFEPANQPYGDWDQIPSSCGEEAPTPTPTPVPSPTPTPTPSPTPSPSPTPTPFPVPINCDNNIIAGASGFMTYGYNITDSPYGSIDSDIYKIDNTWTIKSFMYTDNGTELNGILFEKPGINQNWDTSVFDSIEVITPQGSVTLTPGNSDPSLSGYDGNWRGSGNTVVEYDWDNMYISGSAIEINDGDNVCLNFTGRYDQCGCVETGSCTAHTVYPGYGDYVAACNQTNSSLTVYTDNAVWEDSLFLFTNCGTGANTLGDGTVVQKNGYILYGRQESSTCNNLATGLLCAYSASFTYAAAIEDICSSVTSSMLYTTVSGTNQPKLRVDQSTQVYSDAGFTTPATDGYYKYGSMILRVVSGSTVSPYSGGSGSLYTTEANSMGYCSDQNACLFYSPEPIPSGSTTPYNTSANAGFGALNVTEACQSITGVSIYATYAATINDIVVGTRFKTNATGIPNYWQGQNKWYAISNAGQFGPASFSVQIDNLGTVITKTNC